MSIALSAGVTGLQAHQKMLDVAGNNLANTNTTAYKSSRINFSELLSQTISNASSPTGSVGGTNPQQMGSGVGVASITRDTRQGNIIATGNPLDVAIEGEGYFVLFDGEKNLYTRAGTFGIDEDSTLVDVATGYRVQRTGSTGEPDFQIPGDSTIYIPYETTIEAKATTTVKLAGNLSADQSFETPQVQVISSNISYTAPDGNDALESTKLSALSQCTTGTWVNAKIVVSGYDHDGNTLTDTGLDVDEDTTIQDLLDHIDSVLGPTASATFANGRIYVTDSEEGYSLLDLKLSFTNDGTANLQMPGYFEITAVGGDQVKDINIAIYDAQGRKHILTGALVRTNTDNVWDFVLTSLTGNVHNIDIDSRRVRGLTFSANDGSYAGIGEINGVTDEAKIRVSFSHNPEGVQTIALDFGTVGKFSGLTQVAGASTAGATEQDGYQAGSLTSLSVNSEGTLVGTFSNGIRRNIATLQLALFKNPAGLESVGRGYFVPTVNSGDATATQARTGGAGTIHGGALEKSNVDVATEFVNLIEAQNGYQANARTIRVANDILRELTNLIR
ncbi:MAG: flagellar hook-basal body complex protein [Sedimentisphaerales bacterium]|nr:flagellar hook-basal body complex protein [Sedimentisphaerales bacterium]